jgi:hypothetical protein
VLGRLPGRMPGKEDVIASDSHSAQFLDVVDPHRPTHVEHEDIARRSHGRAALVAGEAALHGIPAARACETDAAGQSEGTP